MFFVKFFTALLASGVFAQLTLAQTVVHYVVTLNDQHVADYVATYIDRGNGYATFTDRQNQKVSYRWSTRGNIVTLTIKNNIEVSLNNQGVPLYTPAPEPGLERSLHGHTKDGRRVVLTQKYRGRGNRGYHVFYEVMTIEGQKVTDSAVLVNDNGVLHFSEDRSSPEGVLKIWRK